MVQAARGVLGEQTTQVVGDLVIVRGQWVCGKLDRLVMAAASSGVHPIPYRPGTGRRPGIPRNAAGLPHRER